jgi:hypothetical protein
MQIKPNPNTSKTKAFLISKIFLALMLALAMAYVIFLSISYKPDPMEQQLMGAGNSEGILVGMVVNNPEGSPPKHGTPKTVFIVRMPSNNVVTVPVPNETPYREHEKVKLVNNESQHGLYKYAFGSYIDKFSAN